MGAGGRTCAGCGAAVPPSEFSCLACGKFYAGSFDAEPVPQPVAAPAPQYQVAVPIDLAMHPRSGPSGLKVLAICAAVVFGLLGLGVVGTAGLLALGSRAETKFVPVGPVPVDDLSVEDRRRLLAPIADGSDVANPIGAAETACVYAADDAPVATWSFDQPLPGGDGEYGQIVQMDAAGRPDWIGTIDLASGSIVAENEAEWTTEMGRYTTMVICALPPVGVPGEITVQCLEATTLADGSHQPEVRRWREQSTIEVYALGNGNRLGKGDLVSADVDCPVDLTESRGMPIDPAAVRQWAVEHIVDGVVS